MAVKFIVAWNSIEFKCNQSIDKYQNLSDFTSIAQIATKESMGRPRHIRRTYPLDSPHVWATIRLPGVKMLFFLQFLFMAVVAQWVYCCIGEMRLNNYVYVLSRVHMIGR